MIAFEQGLHFGQWILKGEKPLGKGGNGEVWLAENSKGIKAAIKFLHSENFGKQRETRFRDEIKFLKNENNRLGILPLIDFYLPNVSTEQDRPWFATPLAKCFTDLELAGDAMLPELVRHIEAVAQTLVKLHAENKWHRDLKPENFFILDGIPVIGDFGLVDFPDKVGHTRDSEAIGSRNYTAPELEQNAAHTPADKADVYSLSKTLWVLASGKPPPQGPLRMDDPDFQFSKKCSHPKASHFDGLLERGTKTNPSDRPTMREFSEELSQWLNPPTVESSTTDLTALTKEYQNVFEIENREKRKRDELIDAAKTVLLSFEPVLKQIADIIKEHTKKETHVGSASHLEPYQFKVFDPMVRLARGVKITSGGDFAAFLQSFVQVEAFDNHTIRIVTGHLVEGTAYGEHLPVLAPFWKKECTAIRGSARLANESEICRVELLNNLGSAICAFGERINKLQSKN
ncbi:MAG TPA: protein kinase [Verrucomicrobiae bacterium]